MNKNSSSGLGCSLLILLGIIISFFQFMGSHPEFLIIIIPTIGLIIWAVRSNRKIKREQGIDNLESIANQTEQLAEGKETTLDFGMALRKGEIAFHVSENVQLVEWVSGGSTYTGTNVGVTFPLVGRVGGMVGGTQGQITKNPDQYAVVDTGRAVFTSERIVFAGAKAIRDWEFDKVVNLQPGPNGITVQIAVSNRDRISGLQQQPSGNMGPGVPAGFAFTYNQEGKEAAKKWAKNLAADLRKTAADGRAELSKKTK